MGIPNQNNYMECFQSTTTRMPQSEEVVRRTDQVTKRIQELAAHMRSSDKCHSFVPHAERIRIAVSELSAIFPQVNTLY
jgi:G protein-coupled receptor kinase-interacting protein 1 C term.